VARFESKNSFFDFEKTLHPRETSPSAGVMTASCKSVAKTAETPAEEELTG
jgi:hypothetical protein